MNQKTITIAALIITVLFVISLGLLILFGVRLSDADKVKAKEIQTNLKTQETKMKADFQSEKEQIITEYVADEVFGSLSFSYPKVWSTYVNQDTSAKEQLIFLADPNLLVFNKQAFGPYPALRVTIFNEKYESRVKEIRGKYITKVKNPYTEEDITVSSVSGKKYTGLNADSKKNYSFILLPLRDKTLYIGTDDSDKYSKNLETIVKSFKVSK